MSGEPPWCAAYPDLLRLACARREFNQGLVAAPLDPTHLLQRRGPPAPAARGLARTVGREQAERAGSRTRRRGASAGGGSSGSNRLLTAPRLLSYNTRAWQASHRETGGVSSGLRHPCQETEQ